jgi:hypothetical protein
MQAKKKERDAQIKKDMDVTGDPYLSLGFGLIAYRNTLFTLGMGLLVMGFLTLPVIKTYRSGSDHLLAADMSRVENTLGNLGYSGVTCATSQLALASVQLTCTYGTI